MEDRFVVKLTAPEGMNREDLVSRLTASVLQEYRQKAAFDAEARGFDLNFDLNFDLTLRRRKDVAA